MYYSIIIIPNLVNQDMAQNEGILEKLTSLGGLGFVLGPIVQCKIFFKCHEFLGVPTPPPNILDPIYMRKAILTKVNFSA